MKKLAFVSLGIWAGCLSGVHAQDVESLRQRSAVVDCRAGCQGSRTGCQTSNIGEIRLNAHPSKVFDTQTLRVTSSWNASDSPGLSDEPRWNKTWMPRDSSHPTMVIISPVVGTCIGRSPHTQGVTFYEWTVDYLN